jgi:hypothetical protein
VKYTLFVWTLFISVCPLVGCHQSTSMFTPASASLADHFFPCTKSGPYCGGPGQGCNVQSDCCKPGCSCKLNMCQ